mmetsp:Transcript_15134/g.32897  ORF Transcript_15134/g.32897 Transcript_15134/m.32897 type:complete len:212 (-) Transcript_15134:259-894(-)
MVTTFPRRRAHEHNNSCSKSYSDVIELSTNAPTWLRARKWPGAKCGHARNAAAREKVAVCRLAMRDDCGTCGSAGLLWLASHEGRHGNDAVVRIVLPAEEHDGLGAGDAATPPVGVARAEDCDLSEVVGLEVERGVLHLGMLGGSGEGLALCTVGVARAPRCVVGSVVGWQEMREVWEGGDILLGDLGGGGGVVCVARSATEDSGDRLLDL